MVTEKTSLNDLFEYAKEATKEVDSGETFVVKDLFRGFEWNRIARGNRIQLGSMYIFYSNNEGKRIVKALDKTPQNQQRYRKI